MATTGIPTWVRTITHFKGSLSSNSFKFWDVMTAHYYLTTGSLHSFDYNLLISYYYIYYYLLLPIFWSLPNYYYLLLQVILLLISSLWNNVTTCYYVITTCYNLQMHYPISLLRGLSPHCYHLLLRDEPSQSDVVRAITTITTQYFKFPTT